jgi:hypothetical protein
MPSEGHMGGLGFPNGQFVDGLDEVARGLAAGTISRGEAIKLGGAALLGSMGVLSLFAGKAEAQGVCEGIPAISNERCPEQRSICGPCGTSCRCARTVSGRKRCVITSGEICPDRDECDSNSDCPDNELCIQIAGCCGALGRPGRNLCVRRCPTDPDMCPPPL